MNIEPSLVRIPHWVGFIYILYSQRIHFFHRNHLFRHLRSLTCIKSFSHVWTYPHHCLANLNYYDIENGQCKLYSELQNLKHNELWCKFPSQKKVNLLCEMLVSGSCVFLLDLQKSNKESLPGGGRPCQQVFVKRLAYIGVSTDIFGPLSSSSPTCCFKMHPELSLVV